MLLMLFLRIDLLIEEVMLKTLLIHTYTALEIQGILQVKVSIQVVGLC